MYLFSRGSIEKRCSVGKKIKVLVIDDSALVREILTEGLSQDPGIEVLGSAVDPYSARDKIVDLNPDVLTLDVEMPRMDGVEFLRKLMPQYPLPVVMVSALTEKGARVTLDALEAGAIDYVTKPKSDVARGLSAMLMELRVKIKIASTANVSHWKHKKHDLPAVYAGKLIKTTDKIIAMGASTGGTEAIRQVLSGFPVTTPGVVIVQHMPEKFTATFADRLNTLCPMEVKEAEDGDRVLTGRALIAPGNQHMEVYRSGGIYQVSLSGRDPVCGHRPSVDVLMYSVAECAGGNAVGVMLTGMGEDGSNALLAMRKKGARTFAQDEKSCVVYGMPKKAYEKGAVELMVPLKNIPEKVLSVFQTSEDR